MKTIICYLITVSVLAFSVSGQELKQLEKASQKTLSEDDSIRKILFDRILPKKQILHVSDGRPFLCLSVNDGEDASENLLSKFSDYEFATGVEVKKASECYIYEEGGIILNASDLKGTIFDVSKLHWKSKNEVKAHAGSRSGNIGGNGCTYTLQKEDEQWKNLFCGRMLC